MGARDPSGAPAQPSGEPPTEAQKQAWRLKRALKVDGKDVEVDLDEEGVARELQKAYALRNRQSRFVEYGNLGQQVLDALKADPAQAFQMAGVNPAEWIQSQLEAHARFQSLTEEQREAYVLKHQNQQLQAQLEERQKAEADAHEQRKLEHIRKATEKRYADAMRKSGLPMTKQMLYRMAEVEKEAWRHADEQQMPRPDFTIDELAQEAKHRLNHDVEAYLGNAEGPQLAELLGPKRVASLLRHAVAKAQARQGIPGVAPAPAVPGPDAEEPEQFLSEQQLKQNMRALRQGKL